MPLAKSQALGRLTLSEPPRIRSLPGPNKKASPATVVAPKTDRAQSVENTVEGIYRDPALAEILSAYNH